MESIRAAYWRTSSRSAITEDDACALRANIHARARAFHRGESPPEVRHYLAPARRSAGARSPKNAGGTQP
jgi:hypothetical protein